MDFEELNDEISNHEERIETILLKSVRRPFDKLLHLLRCLPCFSRLEHNRHHITTLVEHTDHILFLFVTSALQLVLGRIFQKFLVQREDCTLSERKIMIILKNVLECFEIS